MDTTDSTESMWIHTFKARQKLLPSSVLHVGNAPPFHACAVTRGDEEEAAACTAVELL